jgi:DNA-binding NtrC family response regulator
MHLTMPPLRDRRGDVAVLSTHFLRACAQRFGVGEKLLHPETSAWMDKYAWPGNIRELENLVFRECLLADGGLIEIAPPGAAASHNGAQSSTADSAVLNFRQAKTRAIQEFERRYLADVLSAARGNVTKAARLVGKERRAFGRLLKKHDIDKATYCR